MKFDLFTGITMGVKFGNLPCTVRGRVSYALSPFEQRAFAGAVSNGIPNLFKRFYGQVFRVTPGKPF